MEEGPVRQGSLFLEEVGGIQDSTSSSSSSSSSSETNTVGFVIVNIVVLQYYVDRISDREMVGLIRQPRNPHDANAIKVLNTRGIQLGHVERPSAAVLAPLIDAHLITVEGIVPNNPGERNRFKLPCQIHIFARIDEFPTVRSAISGGGLRLISDPDPSFAHSDSVIFKEMKSKKERQSVDEIFKLVADENKKGGRELLEPPKNIIKSELFQHQKEGLGWLVQRENSLELPPFWKEKDGIYVNVLTYFESDKRPEPLSGGIFADDMGLGKTLTLLSLIATNKPGGTHPSSLDTSCINTDNLEEEEDGLSFSLGKRSKKGKSGKRVSGSLKKRKLDGTHLDKKGKGELKSVKEKTSSVLGPKTTLIVCPASVILMWMTQLREHTEPGSFKVYVYLYFRERPAKVEELQKFDIVLTTYSTLAAEAHCADLPLNQMEWWRVILDEAHLIKNPMAKQSKAVINLKAKRRWVVTGTPIQNSSFDLFSLMAFLRFEPFSMKNYWQSLVQCPLDQRKECGLSRLQILMAMMSLRRTKDKGSIELPLKTIETCYVEFSPEEREQYDQMEAEAQNVVQDYFDVGSLRRNYSTIVIIFQLRQICVDMALCPSELRSLLPCNNIEDVSNNPGLLEKLVSIRQDGDGFNCPICISPTTNIIITCCAHIFCRACILRTLKRPNARCPLCRRSLSEADLFSAPPEPFDGGTSSKVSALLKLLVASRTENPSTKSVVFSQFGQMLILLEEPLKEAGFSFLRLDWLMCAKKRAQVIKEFGDRSSKAPMVLLARLKASRAGINLTAASRVYLLEPGWNPAVEEQALDCVHRMGQREDVKIVRLIMRNSIEERILHLQEKKKLARQAFGRKNIKGWRQMHMEDLRRQMDMEDFRTLVSL